MSHWIIGRSYKDHKRNRICILYAVTPYRAKSGCYLDFRYVDGTYIRQPAHKALSRFEKLGGEMHFDMSQIETAASQNRTATAKNITPQIEAFIEANVANPMPTKKRVEKSNASVRYANVIYIDFIKKCRIY